MSNAPMRAGRRDIRRVDGWRRNAKKRSIDRRGTARKSLKRCTTFHRACALHKETDVDLLVLAYAEHQGDPVFASACPPRETPLTAVPGSTTTELCGTGDADPPRGGTARVADHIELVRDPSRCEKHCVLGREAPGQVEILRGRRQLLLPRRSCSPSPCCATTRGRETLGDTNGTLDSEEPSALRTPPEPSSEELARIETFWPDPAVPRAAPKAATVWTTQREMRSQLDADVTNGRRKDATGKRERCSPTGIRRIDRKEDRRGRWLWQKEGRTRPTAINEREQLTMHPPTRKVAPLARREGDSAAREPA